MEVKIYYGDGDVESHTMPEYCGRSITRTEGADERTDVTTSDLDHVLDVVERLHVSEDDGVVLVRTTRVDDCARFYGAADVPKPTTKKILLLSARHMPEVEKVTCDGEAIWPTELTGIEGEIDQLERMVEQLA